MGSVTFFTSIVSLNLSKCYRNAQVTCTTFDRPNLFLAVSLKGTNVFQDIEKLLIRGPGLTYKFPGPTIIYCPTKKKSEKVADELNGKIPFSCSFQLIDYLRNSLLQLMGFDVLLITPIYRSKPDNLCMKSSLKIKYK